MSTLFKHMWISLKTQLLILTITLIVISLTPLAHAGNALYMNADGNPLTWDTSKTIKYKVDAKGLGKLTFAQSLKLIQESMAVWESVEGTDIEFEYLGPTDEVITPKNWRAIAGDRIYAEGYGVIPKGTSESQIENYIVIGFDNTGEIIADKGSGQASGVQSLTGVSGDMHDPGYIISSHLFINGQYYNENETDIKDLELIDLMAIIVHELGHALGLDHNLFHYEMYKKILQGSYSSQYARFLPTMFPRFIKTTGQHMITLHPDDIATLKWMYGDSDFQMVSGEVVNANNEPQAKLLVTARSISQPLCHAYAQATSMICNDMNQQPDGEGLDYFNGKHCMDPDSVGAYTIPILQQDNYTIDVQEIPDFFRFAIAKFDSSIVHIPGGAEFYNHNDQDDESAYIYDEVSIHDEDIDHIDITLSADDSQTQGVERIDFTYFDNSVSLGALIEQSECPLTNDFDIEAIVLDASLALSEDISVQAANSFASAGCSLSNQLTASSQPTVPTFLWFVFGFLMIGFRFKQNA